MKSSANYFCLFALLLLCAVSTSAQTTSGAKQFNKDGLTFNYPSGWSLNDVSNADAQDIQVGRADVDGQLRVWVFRTLIDSPEKLAEAKKVLVDTYVAKTMKDLEQEGGRPQSSPATLDIGGLKADGVKINASLGGEAGAAEIFWILTGRRLVVLTMFRPDRAVKQMAPVWDSIRTSLKIEEPQTQPKPQPTPSATPAP